MEFRGLVYRNGRLIKTDQFETKVQQAGHVTKSGERFEWAIPDLLSYARGDEILLLCSPVFSVTGIRCVLQMTILPFMHRSILDKIEVQLILVDRPMPSLAGCPVTLTSGVKKANGEIVEGDTKTEMVHSGLLSVNSSIETVAFVDLEKWGQEFLPSGTLTFACRIRMGDTTEPTKEEMNWKIQAPGLWKMSADFKNLLHNETDADVVFKVKKREFRAHQFIIRTRSPVLFAMFAHDFQESRTGVVYVDDCDPSTFPDFLHYLYTGRVERFGVEKALHLYQAADKYQLPELKEQSLERLNLGVSVLNFLDVLELSLQYSEKELFETATKYFVANPFEILLTRRWKWFLPRNAAVANELIIKALQLNTEAKEETKILCSVKPVVPKLISPTVPLSRKNYCFSPSPGNLFSFYNN